MEMIDRKHSFWILDDTINIKMKLSKNKNAKEIHLKNQPFFWKYKKNEKYNK